MGKYLLNSDIKCYNNTCFELEEFSADCIICIFLFSIKYIYLPEKRM